MVEPCTASQEDDKSKDAKSKFNRRPVSGYLRLQVERIERGLKDLCWVIDILVFLTAVMIPWL